MLFITLLYVMDPHWVVGMPRYLVWLLFTAAMVLAVYRERMELGGMIPMLQGLRTAFTAFLIASFMTAMYEHLLYVFFDPRLQEYAREVAIEFYKGQESQMSSDQFASLMKDLQTMNTQPSLWGSINKFIFFCVPGFGIAAVVGLSMRREPI